MSGASIPVDLELKKAFQELQTKMIETTQKIKMAEMQMETLRRSVVHSKLTESEIQGLEEDVRLYQGIGRMFMVTKKDEVQKSLEEKIKTSEEKVKTLESNKSYLERSMKESEDNLREMIANKQKTGIQ